MEKILFYDTCALLELDENDIKNGSFYLSSISIEELNSIKESKVKDDIVKNKAKLINRLMRKYYDNFKIIPYTTDCDKELQLHNFPVTNDTKIVISAYYYFKTCNIGCIFITNDNNCAVYAKMLNLETQFYQKENKNYTGYKEITLDNDGLADFYNFVYAVNSNRYNLLPNEYLLIKDANGNCIDQYLFDGREYKDISWYNVESDMMGVLKPKDIYQRMALDSIKRNQLTVLRGRAGTGKSLIGLSYFFQELEQGKIDKIIMFVNPVATKDSCKFGFLPGSATEKILGSQIGKFLLTKIGDMSMVEKLIADEKLVLIPVADCRGLDTSGLHAGVYITEAQNTTKDMMKLILQRIDDNTKVIIEGDDNTQVDMITYAGNNNGLRRLSEVFRGENYYGEVTLKNCYRSKIADRAERM